MSWLCVLYIFLKNSAGKSAADLLEERIHTFKYGGSRSEIYSKLQEEQALIYLRKLENPEETQSGRKTLSKRKIFRNSKSRY